jgi:hypothetical protein
VAVTGAAKFVIPGHRAAVKPESRLAVLPKGLDSGFTAKRAPRKDENAKSKHGTGAKCRNMALGDQPIRRKDHAYRTA